MLNALTETERAWGYIREGFENGIPVVYLPDGSWTPRDSVAKLKGA